MSSTQPTRPVPLAGTIQVTATIRGEVERELSEDGDLRESLLSFQPELFLKTHSEMFATQLEALKVITQDQRENCRNKSTNFVKNDYLYNLIYMQTNAVIPLFIVALEKSDNEHILGIIYERIILNQASADGDVNGIEAGVESPGSENDIPDVNDDNNAELIPMMDQNPGRDSELQAECHTDATVENGCFSSIPWISQNKPIILTIIIFTLLLALGSAVLTPVLYYTIHNQTQTSETEDITMTNSTSTPKLQMGVLPLTVDSPKPIKHNFAEVHLTVEPGGGGGAGGGMKKYDWCNNWSIQNSNSVTKLILKASLDDQDLVCILKSFPKLQHLQFSGNCLCNEFLDDDSSHHRRLENTTKAHPTGPILMENVKTLNISSMTPPCANIYKFVVTNLKFSQLEELTLKDVTIAYENEKYIHEFFQTYGKEFKKMFLRNATLLGNVESPLFSQLYFPNLQEAELQFKRGDSPIEVESLINFNEATPNLEKFKSNVPCFVREWEDLRRKWEYVNVNSNEVCIR